MDAAPTQVLPSFPRIAESLSILSVEVMRCQTLPAIDQGMRMMQMMETFQSEMRSEMRSMRTEMRSEMGYMRAEIQTMNTKIDRLEQKVDRLDQRVTSLEHKVDNLDHRLNGLEIRMAASDRNGIARLQNSIIAHDSISLAPLYSVVTGNVIPGCPSTLRSLDNLTARQVDTVLAQLGEPEGGQPDARKRTLEAALAHYCNAIRTTSDRYSHDISIFF
ncbi:hypothetical protein CDD81_2377 [Ophiocordyceps australis]|uniref:Uncharacterized protein n=1 Tax=Ophiocordyceps australis TaxID=1399860 RepID=A0A2C5XEQ7_9HYPO|nr:hypothetical protein CDD81_2377 [Ophiocordyceps australis]